MTMTLENATAAVAAATPNGPPPDLTQAGPYGVVVVHDAIRVPRPGHYHPTKLRVTASAPAVAPAEPPLPGPPYPVVLLLNGFQARESQYTPFAERLASWGFLVLQYTAPALSIVHDNIELGFAGPVLEWLRSAAATETNAALHGRADFRRLVVAGHSRGAKLAALHFAAALARRAGVAAVGGAAAPPEPAHPYDIHAAFLMDPVDNTRATQESASYPSACRALAATGARVAIAGAGVIGATNPEGSNWRRFWASAGPGSWLGVLPRAGHTKWLQGPSLECWCLDRAFGGGAAARQVVLDATSATMIGWFRQQLAEATADAAAGGGGGGAPRDPLAANGGGAPGPLVAAAAVYGRRVEGCGSEGGGGGGVPDALGASLAPLIAAGELEFTTKGGATTSHPLT
ncbi:MAG: hypothetical protein J3K34DRAFT_457494 [Monoraphidium minutum]|nr:MAG: hypothetical protein J3K34DRAFT_457494 [Monoraphidium minutum]